VRFSRPGVELGFGSIGKGWALDKVAELLGRRGVSRALLSAGGSSFRAIGGRHEGFLVEVRPDRGAALARLRVRDGALGVSGSGEQFFEADGRTYGHVIDPRSGRPVEGTRAAAVVAREAAVADALATAFFVGGPKLAERYCAAHPGTLAMLALPGEGEPRVFGESPAADLVEAA
jgi:thiamine biosynthesis lipoprotein